MDLKLHIYVQKGRRKDISKLCSSTVKETVLSWLEEKMMPDHSNIRFKGKTYYRRQSRRCSEMTLEYVFKRKMDLISKRCKIHIILPPAMAGTFVEDTGDYVALFKPKAQQKLKPTNKVM